MTTFMVLAIIGLGVLIFVCGGYRSTNEKPDDGTAEDATPVGADEAPSESESSEPDGASDGQNETSEEKQG